MCGCFQQGCRYGWSDDLTSDPSPATPRLVSDARDWWATVSAELRAFPCPPIKAHFNAQQESRPEATHSGGQLAAIRDIGDLVPTRVQPPPCLLEVSMTICSRASAGLLRHLMGAGCLGLVRRSLTVQPTEPFNVIIRPGFVAALSTIKMRSPAVVQHDPCGRGAMTFGAAIRGFGAIELRIRAGTWKPVRGSSERSSRR